jgi:hypothetical protein
VNVTIILVRAEYSVSQHVFMLANHEAEDNLGNLGMDGKIILN